MVLSNSQITQLGDRLRSDKLHEADLTLLDTFRQTFSVIDEQAHKIIRGVVDILDDATLTKRKRKTQQSIVDKLRRQPKLRLPQMQDIAGCRIVIEGGNQRADHINALLTQAFDADWGIESKHRDADGYRAIHIIAKADNKSYEIQLRTYAQDIWANLIESKCDEYNTLKYGGTEKEQPLMRTLIQLAEKFHSLDQQAHEVGFARYQQQIEEAIRNVLSH